MRVAYTRVAFVAATASRFSLADHISAKCCDARIADAQLAQSVGVVLTVYSRLCVCVCGRLSSHCAPDTNRKRRRNTFLPSSSSRYSTYTVVPSLTRSHTTHSLTDTVVASYLSFSLFFVTLLLHVHMSRTALAHSQQR